EAEERTPKRTLVGGWNEKTIAEQAEKTGSFQTLALALFPAQMGSLHVSMSIASEIFRRCGFYGGVQADQNSEELWARAEPFTRARTARQVTILMLDGCHFPVPYFRLLNHEIKMLTADDKSALEPPQDFFFPR